MPTRVTNQLKFQVERLMLRGPQYRLLVIAALIGLISITAGAIVHYFDAGFTGTDYGDAVWWSFLRLTDPGYLGDDEGTLERTVSTILTVLGYVIFLGALVAILTQWLNERMAELELGLTPIAQRDHLLIIGWTNRTPTIVRELVLSSGRVRRLLRRRGARTLRIAILADEVTTALSLELRDRLGSLWNERQVILRTGSPLRIEHLRRVDFMRAAAVIMPAADFRQGGPSQADTRAIKTLLSMTNQAQSHDTEELPLAVVEIFDARKIRVARRAYGGPIELLASDSIIARLLAQNVRHRGLSHVYSELLTHGHGNEIYIRECTQFEGMPFHDLPGRFTRAVLLGIVREVDGAFRPLLNPAPGTTVLAGDRLALMSRSYANTDPAVSGAVLLPPPDATRRLSPTAPTRPLRLLVLGWSHKVPALLREFDSYTGETFEIDVISTAPIDMRETALGRYDFTAERITARQIEADYTTPSVLEKADLTSYDNIVLLGSDRLGSGEESDARSIMAYLLLRDLLPEGTGPNVLIELLDAGNNSLFRRRQGEVIISPVILSHMLAQVALRRELRAVFDELFGPGGAEIIFRNAMDYDLAGDVSFSEITAAAHARGEIALGVRPRTGREARGGGIALNPDRSRRFEMEADDQVVVLTRY